MSTNKNVIRAIKLSIYCTAGIANLAFAASPLNSQLKFFSEPARVQATKIEASRIQILKPMLPQALDPSSSRRQNTITLNPAFRDANFAPGGRTAGSGAALSGGTVVDGGGGKGIVCYDPKGVAKTVETLDLFEGRMNHDFKYSTADKEKREMIINSALRTIRETGYLEYYYENKNSWFVHGEGYAGQSIGHFISHFNAAAMSFESTKKSKIGNFKFLEGQSLTLTQDSYEVYFPRNCRVEQIAIYKENRGTGAYQVFIDYDLFEMMDAKNQAALILHEGIYEWLRKSSFERNSIRTRKLVSQLLEKNLKTAVTKELEVKSIDCVSRNLKHVDRAAKFSVIRIFESGGKTWPVALYLNGVKVFSETAMISVGRPIQELIRSETKFGSVFAMTDLDSETNVSYLMGGNGHGQIEIKLSGVAFTNGAEPFEETLLCENENL